MKAHVFFLLFYLVCFCPPLAARSWRSLAWVFGGSVAFVAGSTVIARGSGGFLVFAWLFLIAIVAAGLTAGCVTRAVLLAARPSSRLVAAAIVLAGASAVPSGLLGWSFHLYRESWAAYALLPTAQSLPAIPACERFRSSSPLLEALVAHDADKGKRVPAAFDTHIRYPIVYRELRPPHLPEGVSRESRMQFQMHIADASPVVRKDEYDEDGNWIRYDKRKPYVSFQVLAREPVSRSASRALRGSFGEFPPSAEMPDLVLFQSPYPGLLEVENEVKRIGGSEEDRFVSLADGAITDLLECNAIGKVPNPGCRFHFDRHGTAIEGRFRRAVLPEWPKIKTRIEDFVDCITVERIPVPAL